MAMDGRWRSGDALTARRASEGGPRDCTRPLASASGCHCHASIIPTDPHHPGVAGVEVEGDVRTVVVVAAPRAVWHLTLYPPMFGKYYCVLLRRSRFVSPGARDSRTVRLEVSIFIAVFKSFSRAV